MWAALLPFEELHSGMATSVPQRQAAEALLKEYELLDRLSLLELAAIKNVILAEEWDNVGIFDALDFLHGGWKIHKAVYVKSSQVAIIMRCVTPFLHKK